MMYFSTIYTMSRFISRMSNVRAFCWLAVGLCFCGAWLSAPQHVSAKDFVAVQETGAGQRSATEVDDSWHFRFDLLQMLLEERGLQVVDGIDVALASPRNSVIVIVGDRPALSPNDWGALIGFVLDGGTLLLASDSSFMLQGVGRFSKGPVTTSNSNDQYQGFEDCILVRPESPAFEGVTELVTNRSGWFAPNTVGWLQWEVVARLPDDCRPVASREHALLAIGRWGKKDTGLAIMSADASIFSNGMLWHGDNAVAAIRVSDLLCSEGKSQLAFLSDGVVLDSYRNRIDPQANDADTPEMPDVPEPQLDKALRLANAIAKEVAESNIMNEALRQRPRGVQPSRYFRVLLYLMAALLLIGTVAVILMNGTFQSLFLPPRKMRSAYEMREHANSSADDFRNSAGYLARDFCWELTGSRNTADWQRFLAALISKPGTMSKSEYTELARIIDIACRGCHIRMSSQEFQRLGKALSMLRAKRREGGLTG